jgi:hypothetical protein
MATQRDVGNIYVDAANPEVWETLKREFGERYEEQYLKEQMAYCKKYDYTWKIKCS